MFPPSQTPYYIICCIHPYSKCYYLSNTLKRIPFELAESVQLQKITITRHFTHTHDLFPAFLKFQKRIKAWFRKWRSPRTILRRELYGNN